MPGGVAPELNRLPNHTIELWLAVSSLQIGLSRWGSAASHAHALLTAHYLTQCPGHDGLGGDEVGPLTSEANGPASRSFASAPPSDAELGATSYGRAYLTLRRAVRGRGSGVVGNSGARAAPWNGSKIGVRGPGFWRW
jgi:Protein of unknown function (DUF4054)